jgi:hypothetical protein
VTRAHTGTHTSSPWSTGIAGAERACLACDLADGRMDGWAEAAFPGSAVGFMAAL